VEEPHIETPPPIRLHPKTAITILAGSGKPKLNRTKKTAPNNIQLCFTGRRISSFNPKRK